MDRREARRDTCLLAEINNRIKRNGPPTQRKAVSFILIKRPRLKNTERVINTSNGLAYCGDKAHNETTGKNGPH